MLNPISFLGANENLTSTVDSIGTKAYDTFKGIVNVVLPVIASFLLVLGIILGVKVGIAFAKAEDDEGKKKAKSQLINILVGFIVAIVITAVIEIILNTTAIKDLFRVNKLKGVQ